MSLDAPDAPLLDLAAIAAAPAARAPYAHVIAPNALRPGALEAIRRDFPPLDAPGSHAIPARWRRGAFGRLIEEMSGAEFARTMGAALGLELQDAPTMFTLRARARSGDGKIHTDSATKIATVLLYLNPPEWTAEGGRLRVLRAPDDLEDYAAEVPANGGALLGFRRSENSWHGHAPFEGPRRAIQMNWVISRGVATRELARHRLSALGKRLGLAS